ncbi:MAG TPA: hypothetical protein EYQ58_04245 [Candidatus Poseidoniales archaeon]|jgi:hypothetical protein|nr:hypothetical protein [Candidatus Poseidoniales archaeon]
MPTCRHCSSKYPREYFIHGNGPRTQVCVRCGVEQGLVTEEETPTLFNTSQKNARFSVVARRYSFFLYLPMLWIFWSTSLSEVTPWGMYFLIILIILTLLTPLWFIYRSSQFSGDMARLTPAHERPKGH